MAEVTVALPDSSRLSAEGRIVIPASVRKALGLHPGDLLSFHVEENRVVMSSPEAAIARLRELFGARRSATDESLVDELLRERRAEAQRESS